jgi:serine/threonine protein kinase
MRHMVHLIDYLLHSEDFEFERTQLTTQQRLQILHDITVGIRHLHIHKIVHGGIKSNNALLFDGRRVKLGDFGLSKVYGSVRASSRRDTANCGTPGYMAPEVLDGDTSITCESDIYSVSFVMFEVITQTLPYAGMLERQIDRQVTAGRRPVIANMIDGCEVIKPLINECWSHDAKLRPTADSVVNSIGIELDSAKMADRVVSSISMGFDGFKIAGKKSNAQQLLSCNRV